MEDEAALRRLSRRVLAQFGYTVLEAPNGEEALRLAEAYHGPINLVLTDVVMPRLSGRDLAAARAGEPPRGEGPVHERLHGRRGGAARRPDPVGRAAAQAVHAVRAGRPRPRGAGRPGEPTRARSTALRCDAMRPSSITERIEDICLAHPTV